MYNTIIKKVEICNILFLIIIIVTVNKKPYTQINFCISNNIYIPSDFKLKMPVMNVVKHRSI